MRKNVLETATNYDPAFSIDSHLYSPSIGIRDTVRGQKELSTELADVSTLQYSPRGVGGSVYVRCLVLAPYLHTSIALFYASFVVVMVYLPSARYHTELSDVTPDNVQDTVKSVFIFGALEFVSFGLLAVMIYEKYGMQAFYHLAFVLETQVALFQSKVMMWMLIILAFRVAHFGKSTVEVLNTSILMILTSLHWLQVSISH